MVLAVTPQTVGFYSFLLTWISGSLLLMLALHLKVDRVEGKPVCSNWLFTFIAFFQVRIAAEFHALQALRPPVPNVFSP